MIVSVVHCVVRITTTSGIIYAVVRFTTSRSDDITLSTKDLFLLDVNECNNKFKWKQLARKKRVNFDLIRLI